MKKILIVDDSTFMRMLLKDLLLEKNEDDKLIKPVKIIEANNQASAEKKIKDEHPDLVLLDIVMENDPLEGVAVLEKIKKDYPNIDVIMITSVGQESVIDKCKKFGAAGYIQKPFSRDEIIAEVNKCLLQ